MCFEPSHWDSYTRIAKYALILLICTFNCQTCTAWVAQLWAIAAVWTQQKLSVCAPMKFGRLRTSRSPMTKHPSVQFELIAPEGETLESLFVSILASLRLFFKFRFTQFTSDLIYVSAHIYWNIVKFAFLKTRGTVKTPWAGVPRSQMGTVPSSLRSDGCRQIWSDFDGNCS